MRRSALAALLAFVLIASPSAAWAAESADIALSPDAGYWPRWVMALDAAQTRGGVEVRVEWAGLADSSSIPAGVRALDVTEARTYIGLRLRIENGTANDATLMNLDNASTIFGAGGAALTTNVGPVMVRDPGNAQGRADIPSGTFRTYDLVWRTNQPESQIQTLTLHLPRLRGVRWAPIGDSDYTINVQFVGL